MVKFFLRLDRPVEKWNRDHLPQPFITTTPHEVFMNSIDQSNHIRLNYKPSKKSISFRNPIYGVGINDADYTVSPTIDGKVVRCKAYLSWTWMLVRACSDRYKKENSTYTDVSVSSEWKSFMKFREWWVVNYVDGWQLDKDILSLGSGIYGNETCLYIPQWLNKFITDTSSSRGLWLIGATWHKQHGMFMAQCSNPITGKGEKLGYFINQEDAHKAWKSRKMDIAFQLKDLMDAIDPRVYFMVTDKIMRSC